MAKKPATLKMPKIAPTKYNVRLGSLNDYLVKHGFALDGEEAIGGIGNTAVWDKRSETPKLIPNSGALVDDYRIDKRQTPKHFLALIDAPEPEKLAALEKQIQSFACDLARNSWRVGDGINAYRQLLPLPDAKLSERLKLGMSPARVGQLRNTAEFFPRELRDDAIAFEAYNEARARNKATKLDAAKLAELVKANPSVAAVKTAMPRPKTESKLHDLRIIVSMTEKDGEPEYTAKVLIDGEKPDWTNADEWMGVLIGEAIREVKEAAKSVGVPYADEGGTSPDEQPAEVAAI